MRFRLTPLLQNFLSLSGTLTIGKVIRFTYFLIIARLLGAEETGIYVYGVGFYLALMVLANFGQSALLASRLKRRPASASRLISHSLSLRLISICFAVSIGLLITVLFESDERTRTVVYVFLAALVARSFASWVRECFVGLEESTWIVRWETLFRGSEAMIGILLLGLGAGLLAVVCLHFAIWTAEAVFSFVKLKRYLGREIALGKGFRIFRVIVPISFVFALSFGLISVFPQLGILMLKAVRSDFAVIANFGIAMQFFATFAIFPIAMGLAVMPAVSRLSRKRDFAEIANLTIVVRLALLSGTLFAIFSAAYGPYLVSTLLGEGYVLGGTTFAAISWALGPYSAALIAGQVLNAMNAKRLAVRGGIIMVAVHGIAFAALIPLGPLEAAIWSLMIGALLGCAANCFSLVSVLATRGHLWWLCPLGFCTLVFLLSVLVPLPATLSAPAFVLLSWWLGLLRGSEVLYVLRRFGFNPPGNAANRIARRPDEKPKTVAAANSPPGPRDLAV